MKRRKRYTGLKLMLAGIVAFGGMAGSAYAAQIFFNAAVDSNWTNGPNWSSGSFPTTADYASFTDVTADAYSAQPNGLLAVRMDTGVLNVQTGGVVNATVHTSWGSRIADGASTDATLNILGGTCSLNFIEVGCNINSTGTINVVDGTLISSRGSKGVSGMSMHLGNYDHNGNAGGLGILNISGGTFKTRTGLELGKSAANGGGSAVFAVLGSGAEHIGVGTQGSGDGLWKQYSNSVLRAQVDAGGITPIEVNDYNNDGGAVTDFYEGSLLDVGFLDGFEETNAWTVMLSEGTMTDWGMSFVDTVDTNDWGYRVVPGTNYTWITESLDASNNVVYVTNTIYGDALQIAYGLGWSAGEVSTNVPPPGPGRNLWWTGNNGDSDPFAKENWSLDNAGLDEATWGVYDTDHWKLGNSAYTDAPPVVVDYVDDERFYKNAGTLAMGDGVPAILNVYHDLIFGAQANNTIGQAANASGTNLIAATINVYDGSALQFNALRMGINGASTYLNIDDGEFLIGRGYSGSTYDSLGNSLYLGWNGGGTNSLRIAGGSIRTRGGVTLGGHGSAAVTSLFHVDGSGATEIGIGAHSSVNGVWNQGSDATLKVTVDEGGLTPINVVISQANPDNKMGDVYFHTGSLLDVDWADDVTNYGGFVVMTWDGTLQTNELAFAPAVDTGTWGMVFEDADGNGSNDTLRVVTPIGETAAGTPLWWLYAYGLDGEGDYGDSDDDGMENWAEYVAGTDPTNALSVLIITAAEITDTDYAVTWQSVAGKSYSILTDDVLGVGWGTTNAAGIVGLPSETSYTGTLSGAGSAEFLSIGVQNP